MFRAANLESFDKKLGGKVRYCENSEEKRQQRVRVSITAELSIFGFC